MAVATWSPVLPASPAPHTKKSSPGSPPPPPGFLLSLAAVSSLLLLSPPSTATAAAEEGCRTAGLTFNSAKAVRNAAVVTAWGCCLEGDVGLLGVPRDKLLALMEVTLDVAMPGVVDLELLESLLGSWAYVFSFRRPLFSLFCHVYKHSHVCKPACSEHPEYKQPSVEAPPKQRPACRFRDWRIVLIAQTWCPLDGHSSGSSADGSYGGRREKHIWACKACRTNCIRGSTNDICHDCIQYNVDYPYQNDTVRTCRTNRNQRQLRYARRRH